MSTPRTARPWFALLAAVCAGLLALAFAHTMVTRPMHADEAVQWSLFRDLRDGLAYSGNQDRFHGPVLVALTNGLAMLTGLGPNDCAPAFLRAVPLAFAASLVLLPWVLPGVSRRAAVIASVALLVAPGFGRYAVYFVQEMLLAAGFAWGVALWLRGAPEGRGGLLAASGAAFGFALACKVTALAYFACLVVAWVLCRRSELTLRSLGFFAPALLGSWVFFQTSFGTDWAGLGAWLHQFRRSFGVATGVDEGTLAMDSPWPWVAAGLPWAALAWSRWLARRDPRTGEAGAADAVWVCATLILGFHAALPYKTPWLLLTPTALLVALVLPMGFSAPSFRLRGSPVYVALLIGFGLDRPFSHPGHTATTPEVVRFAEQAARFEQAYGAARFYVAVEGGHYWPLPYYLRRQRVGYGDFAGAERAPLRLRPVTDAQPPELPGYVALSLPIRAGEYYWVLVAKGYESHFTSPGP